MSGKVSRSWLFAGAALFACSGLVVAQDAPESLLPPGFDDPTPAPTAAPAPAARPTISTTIPGDGGTVSQPVVQQLPQIPSTTGIDFTALPSADELAAMSTDELDELLGLKPKFDIPPAARRSTARVGLLSQAEGGFPARSLAKQPGALVKAALANTRGPLVSRWGHIMLRRVLASRLAAPEGMDPVEFAALRAQALDRMGEYPAARGIAQDVDTQNWNAALTDAALEAYLALSDITGACPAVRLQGGVRDDAQWTMLQAICDAYAGEETRAGQQLNRALSREIAPRIDVLLAQRYAGAAGNGRKAVDIEWEGVEELTPWRFALANALGEEVPDSLLKASSDYFREVSATAPMLGLPQRAEGAFLAASRGVLSSHALVDLYSQIYADDEITGPYAVLATQLREAYVGVDAAQRLTAIRTIWGDDPSSDYGRMVLTAYASARMAPSADFDDDAAALIASMLTAGLDRDAVLWSGTVEKGSEAWALLALASPTYAGSVATDDIDSFFDDDSSAQQRKSRFLLAGLAGLERLEPGAMENLSKRLGVNMIAATPWTQKIDAAAKVNNPTLVAILAGVGMQGSSWDRMTARHLYHIVSALHRVGLDAEARMIAAEAVARA